MSDKHPIKQRQALDVYICLAYIALLSLPSCSRLLYSCTIMVKLIYFHTYLSLSLSLSLSTYMVSHANCCMWLLSPFNGSFEAIK
jgi:hypothetical protein